MYYAEIKDCDIANGIGVRITLFVSGCTNHCKNCFQPETWDFNYGNEFTDETADQIINMLDRSYIDGLTILGGEPMEPKNQQGVLEVIRKVREKLPEKNIWIYSGFKLEQLRQEGAYCRTDATDEILAGIDVLVDGRYVDELRDISLKFRGSSNQRVIDMKKTEGSGEIVLFLD